MDGALLALALCSLTITGGLYNMKRIVSGDEVELAELMDYFGASEQNIRDRVDKLSFTQLSQPRGEIIEHLLPTLLTILPTLRWKELSPHVCQLNVTNRGLPMWEVRATCAADDPHYVLSHIPSFSCAHDEAIDAQYDPSRRELTLTKVLEAETGADALREFNRRVHNFRSGVDLLRGEIHRFNQAVPYLIGLFLTPLQLGYACRKSMDEGQSVH